RHRAHAVTWRAKGIPSHMGVEEQVRGFVSKALADLVKEGALPSEVLGASFAVERPKRPEHGDLATNAALAVQKLAKKPPREIAGLLEKRLRESPSITSVEIAGPGFLNLRLAPAAFHRVMGEIVAQGPAYGRAPAAMGERILLEFVSANPTGPLLISHGRGAILGDAVGSVLEAAGHRVVREYYLNDAGNQVRLLAESVRAALQNLPPPEGGYGGDSSWKPMAEALGWPGTATGKPGGLTGVDRDAELIPGTYQFNRINSIMQTIVYH
ncbi:MAG: arginine--tRNA ligase, partial [Polyangiaceae bacterium]|nr:arginine--tRNA ligase [Polyangiaceae bacterium]